MSYCLCDGAGFPRTRDGVLLAGSAERTWFPQDQHKLGVEHNTYYGAPKWSRLCSVWKETMTDCKLCSPTNFIYFLRVLFLEKNKLSNFNMVLMVYLHNLTVVVASWMTKDGVKNFKLEPSLSWFGVLCFPGSTAINQREMSIFHSIGFWKLANTKLYVSCSN